MKSSSLEAQLEYLRLLYQKALDNIEKLPEACMQCFDLQCHCGCESYVEIDVVIALLQSKLDIAEVD